MISFKESLQIKKTEKLAEECFSLMLNHNIDPELFVEWLNTHSESADISNKAVNWITTEIKLNEQGILQKIGGYFQNLTNSGSQTNQDPLTAASQSAISKLTDLLKKSQRQGSKLNQDSVQNSLQKVLQVLKNTPVSSVPPALPKTPQTPQPIKPMAGAPLTIQQAQQQMAQGAKNARASSGEEYFGDSTVNVIDRKLLEARIKNLCYVLEEKGYQSENFVKWIINEYTLGESNWLGAAWQGIKGGLSSGFDRIMGGGEGSVLDAFRKGYKGGQQEKYDQYDTQAIEDAVKHLNDFASKLSAPQHQELSKQIAELSAVLKNISISKPAPQPTQPTDPTSPTSPEPADKKGSDSDDMMKKLSAYSAQSQTDNSSSSPVVDDKAKAEEFLKNYPEKTTKGKLSVVGSIRKLPKDMQDKILQTDEYKAVMAKQTPPAILALSKKIKSMTPASSITPIAAK